MPDVFQILADPTRRRLVDALRTGERSVSELVDVVNIGQPGVSRQLAILQDAHFVVVRPEGRRRLYALRPEPFGELDAWVRGHRDMWEARLDRFAAELERRTQGRNEDSGNQLLGDNTMQTTRPCLAFNEHAEEAINLYVSVIPNSRILSLQRSDGNGPVPKGNLMHATFELDGREYTAFDGGPQFSFTEGFSLMVTCDTQQQIDETWTRLMEGGGEESMCGWLKDRFGVSWQVIPASLGTMLTDSASGNTGKAMEAMLGMRKLDIAALEQAYRSKS